MAKIKVKLLRALKEDEKLAPQQKVIYDHLLAFGVGKEIDRETLVKNVEDSKKIETRQTVERVVAYYIQDFKKKGMVETIKPEPAPKEEKKDKPAKETATGGETKPAKADAPKSPAEAPGKPAKAA